MGTNQDDTQQVGSFAEGSRTLPRNESNGGPGDFAEGIEQHHGGGTVGHYSEGIEQAHAEHERMGSFADTDCPLCRERAQASR